MKIKLYKISHCHYTLKGTIWRIFPRCSQVNHVKLLIWNRWPTDGVLQRLKSDLLSLRFLHTEIWSDTKTARWTKGQVHSADGYLWCIRTERKVHVHLQRDSVSNALPLRQTILFYNKTVIQSEFYETGASISALILLLKWTLKPTAIKYLPAVFEKHYHQLLNNALDRLFLFTVHTGILNNHC